MAPLLLLVRLCLLCEGSLECVIALRSAPAVVGTVVVLSPSPHGLNLTFYNYIIPQVPPEQGKLELSGIPTSRSPTKLR